MVYMKILKRNQIIVTVIALMLVAAGYLNFANQNRENNLIPTSSVADSEMMAGIGDAQLVNANEVSQNNVESDTNQENIVNEVKNTNISEQTQEDSYFDETRLEREKMYSQMLENYQKILETNNLSSDEKKNAQEENKRNK